MGQPFSNPLDPRWENETNTNEELNTPTPAPISEYERIKILENKLNILESKVRILEGKLTRNPLVGRSSSPVASVS